MAQSDVIIILQRYIKLLNASGITITKAFLYGSYARNEATSNSDIDVMLISEMFDRDDDRVRAKAWTLTEKVDIRIEPYTLGEKKYFADDISPLLQIIKKEGIEISLNP